MRASALLEVDVEVMIAIKIVDDELPGFFGEFIRKFEFFWIKLPENLKI